MPVICSVFWFMELWGKLVQKSSIEKYWVYVIFMFSYLSVPLIDFERSAEDLGGIAIPQLTPQTDPIPIATTDSVPNVTTEPVTIATTEPVTIATTESVTIATTEFVPITTREPVPVATAEPVGIPQTTKEPQGLQDKIEAHGGDKEKTEVPQGVKDRTEAPRGVKEKTEAPQGDGKLTVQEPIPIRRSKNFFPHVLYFPMLVISLFSDQWLVR